MSIPRATSWPGANVIAYSGDELGEEPGEADDATSAPTLEPTLNDLSSVAEARAEASGHRPTTESRYQEVCAALGGSASDNDLPLDFFTRLIWQESRFDPNAVSRAGAQGIAQFMPDTARRRGLQDPFDPGEAIQKSAELLRDLKQQFGNLGLAAAAYNAGPKRLIDWRAGRRALPRETRDYVRIVTGRSAGSWTALPTTPSEVAVAEIRPCVALADLVPRDPLPAPGGERRQDAARGKAAKRSSSGTRPSVVARVSQQRRPAPPKAHQRLAARSNPATAPPKGGSVPRHAQRFAHLRKSTGYSTSRS